MTEETAALAGYIEGFIDGFLHIAASLGQYLAHFAGHIAGVFFLALLEEDTGADENFRTLGCRDQTPRSEGFLGRSHGQGHVFGVRGGEGSHHVGVVGWVQIEDGFAACGRQPLAADEIVECGIGHESLGKAVDSEQ